MKMKVVYIGGYGRSGSTITDILFHQNNNIASFGELTNLFIAGWINDEFCSCGKSVKDCTFWSEVKKQWLKKSNFSIHEYYNLQSKYTNKFSLVSNLKNNVFESREFYKFSNDTKLLYEIISDISKSNLIVDSSKSPFRLYFLKSIGLDVKVVHLVRDGRGVANSLKKHFKPDLESGVQKELKPKPVYRTALSWVLTNYLIEKITPKEERYLLKYEDLLENGESELKNIEDYFGIDLTASIETIANNKILKKGHTVAGNRLRMKEGLRINTTNNTNWKNLTESEINIFNRIAGPMLKKYGYR